MAKELKYADKASQELMKVAIEKEIETVWDRYEAMQPQCGFGTTGLCCRHCMMGPCRIDPFGKGPKVGVCGSDADTITARGIARMIAGGTSAHSDHGRDVAHLLRRAAENPGGIYTIKNPEKLKAIAEVYEIPTKDREITDIAKDVAEAALEEFGRQDGEGRMAVLAPEARQKIWKELGIYPRAIDREVVELMHRTTMGVDADYKHIMKQGMRTARPMGGLVP